MQADTFMSQIQQDEYRYQPVFQKKAPNNIFIVKFKNFTPGVKILEFKSNRKSQDFLKRKNYMNHSNWNIFGGGIFLRGVNFRGGSNFSTHQKKC